MLSLFFCVSVFPRLQSLLWVPDQSVLSWCFTVIKMNRIQKAKGEVLLKFIAIFTVFLRGQALSITPLSNGASYNII